MTTLDEAAAIGRSERGLAVVATVRADGTVHSTLVNAGVLPHPVTREPVLAFVTYGPVKLSNLRTRPQLAATFRSGWTWATVEGEAELAGPDDRRSGRPGAALPAPACGLRRRGRNARRLGGVRPGHGRAAPDRRARGAAPGLRHALTA